MKVLLILVDGMRPDALHNVNEAKCFMQRASYTLSAKTVMPSVTLPCHMSLFHSVDPLRHGTTTNTYAPQVRPINGLFDVLAASGKKCAFFYNWEPLRDLSRPGALDFDYFVKGTMKNDGISYDKANDMVTDAAIYHLKNFDIDFSFLYLGHVDEVGHKYGWLGAEYMESLEKSWANIRRVIDSLTEEYTVIVTADHGGHDRIHGTEMPEDMTIPVFILGKDFKASEVLANVSIKDIAPTVAKLLNTESDDDWEGKALF